MTLSFTKMHGLGNDFVVIDTRHSASVLDTDMIKRLCDRRHGVGCDQLVLLAPPTLAGADVHVRFFNPDGSEAGACGNASRCVALYLNDLSEPVLQTQAGLLPTKRHADLITVNMGVPRLEWHEIPLSHACDTLHLPLHDAAACSMGNPHATLFHSLRQAENLGPLLEHDALFPERANIGFAEITSPQHMRLRVWERGAGLTPACGSGACAAVVNAARRGLTERTCTVEVDGGTLRIEWREDNTVWMTGPATRVFDGTLT
ncbi:diaminopimelate epimerase [Neokomagataea thailandica NBRC 106555]|uniref:Diaminopimelate epimerase n=1 Tax=Neokomagataea thailandica NBRC 106555 TaxID=1223520 RepID=A0ABQ0QQV2_9PROT|nr:diaminopimelate epimerase [Neokomagataea thailandica]GBR53703.1 diaminopimelate epimerase [Neokomagataea thailandica NBRC 106555]